MLPTTLQTVFLTAFSELLFIDEIMTSEVYKGIPNANRQKPTPTLLRYLQIHLLKEHFPKYKLQS